MSWAGKALAQVLAGTGEEDAHLTALVLSTLQRWARGDSLPAEMVPTASRRPNGIPLRVLDTQEDVVRLTTVRERGTPLGAAALADAPPRPRAASAGDALGAATTLDRLHAAMLFQGRGPHRGCARPPAPRGGPRPRTSCASATPSLPSTLAAAKRRASSNAMRQAVP